MNISKKFVAGGLLLGFSMPSRLCAQNQVNLTSGVGSALPPLVQQIVNDIQESSPKDITTHFTLGSVRVHLPHSDILETITKCLGPAQRDVGSGTHIYEWDVGGGVLRMPSIGGPSYTSKKGDTTWLIKSESPVCAHLLGHYEVISRVYAGNLILKADGKYQFIAAGTSTTVPPPTQSLFFALHPVGSFSLELAEKINANTLLEDLPKGTTIAT